MVWQVCTQHSALNFHSRAAMLLNSKFTTPIRLAGTENLLFSEGDQPRRCILPSA